MDEKKISTVKYENLSFEGGGVKGFAYIGAILKLEELGILKDFKRYSGASVGSIFAVLLCVGFSANEILEISNDLDISMPSKYCCGKLYSIWSTMGIYSLSKLEKTFRKVLTKKIDPDITLKKLYEITKKDLVIVTTNLNRKIGVYLHYKCFPDVKLIDAIISSISIPGVFQARKMNYLGHDDYYIDGGIIDNYPIWVFNDLVKLNNGEINKINKNSEIPKTTLGLKLLCNNETNTYVVDDSRIDISNIQSYFSEVINTLIVQIERSDITTSYIEQTVSIKVPAMSFVNISIDKKQTHDLIHCGKTALDQYFKK